MNIPAKKALVICAHDDDEVIGPGGTIRKMANDGIEVTTLIFATGNEGYRRIEDRDTIIADRVKERTEAGHILGTKHCLANSYGDFSNLDQEHVYREVIRAVRLVRPDVVFSHLPTDYIAHRTLSKLIPEAVWQAGWECSATLGDPWAVKRLYLFPILELVRKPSHIIDISDTFEAKLEAMKAYKSQHAVVSGILDQIETKARVYGSLAGVRYGEAFMRSQEIPIMVSRIGSIFESEV